ncbi:MAG: peptidylprolyl isomerase, partial [Patescibacteria group bacterium]|nr:peptidylprolyl isomerase [Patescibacteria group bacterium]
KTDKKLKKPKIKKNYLKNFLRLILNFSNKHKNNFIKSFKKSISLCFLLFIIFVLLYFALAVTILKFNIDNNFFRRTNKYIPIPAFIAKGKIIDYYLWRDIIASANGKTKVSARAELAKYLVINELATKYNLPYVDFSNLNNKKIIESIAEKAANDAQLNQVAVNRIYSIKEMIKTKNDFIRVSEKYGDELGKATITTQNKNQYPYADAIKNLKVNEVSEIINTQNGHYIFLCFGKTQEKQVLSYVFIKNKPFEQILNELISEYRIISFAD